MPALDADIVPHLTDQELRTNFIVELLTPTPRRWTNYRGRTATGSRGLVIGGNTYATRNVTVPKIDEKDGVAPARLTITVGNADNTQTDLWSNTANLRAPVTITKLWFFGTWDDARPPTSIETEAWFEGIFGRPRFQGELMLLDCVADTGRRGKSPRTRSLSLMTTHAPLKPGKKITL